MEGRTPSSAHAMPSGAFRAGADEGVRLFFVALVFVLLLSPTLFAIPRVAGVVMSGMLLATSFLTDAPHPAFGHPLPASGARGNIYEH